MKTAYLSVLVVVLLVYTSESHPSHGKRGKTLKKELQGPEFANLTLNDQKVKFVSRYRCFVETSNKTRVTADMRSRITLLPKKIPFFTFN